MGSYSYPALNIRTPEIDPMGQYARIQQLRQYLQGQQQQQQLGELRMEHERLQIDQARTAQAQQLELREGLQAFANIYRENDGDPGKVIQAARQGGVPFQIIQQFEESVAQQRKDYAAKSKDDLEVLYKQRERQSAGIMNFLDTVTPENRERLYPQWMASQVAAGIFPQEGTPPQYPGDEMAELLAIDARRDLNRLKWQAEQEEKRTKLTTHEQDFQTFYATYLEASGLPKNAKVELQARRDYELLDKAPKEAKGPKDISKDLAELERWRTQELNKLQRLLMKPKMAGGLAGQTTPEFAAQRKAIEESYQRQLGLLQAGKPVGGAPAAAGVKMRAPTGQIKLVPREQVEHYKSLGAVVVE